jgi:hypothetical protein
MPYSAFKLIAVLVVALIAAAIVYAAYISLTHWGGIGV